MNWKLLPRGNIFYDILENIIEKLNLWKMSKYTDNIVNESFHKSGLGNLNIPEFVVICTTADSGG